MADHSNDESMDRLGGSDPATGSHPDLHRLRNLIAHRAPASQETGADKATGIDDELLRGPRLRAPWVAAAAVAALGVGVGGYAVGVQQGDSTVIVADAPLSPAAQGGLPGLMPGIAQGSDAVGGPAVSEGEASEALAEGVSEDGGSMGYDPGPVRLVAGPDLPTERSTGQMQAVVATQGAQEFVESWAAASDFTGQPLPETDEEYGEIGLIDSESGRMMTVFDEGGGLSYSYTDIYRDEYCAEMYTGITEEDMTMMREEWASTYGDVLAMPGPETCITPTGPRPTDDEAIAMASDFLASTGVPMADYTLEVSEWAEEGSVYVSVEAWPGEQQYGMLHGSVTVSPDGIVNAYGSVGEMTSLGDYQLISPAEAVQRYAQREFSMEYSVDLPDMYEDFTSNSDLEYTEYSMPETAPIEPGMKLRLLLKEKTVVDAELVQGTMWTDTGGLEVPAWKLITEDGMSYPVLALADEEIDWTSWE